MTATITTKSPKCTRRSARDHNRRRLHERQQRMLDRIENRPGPEREEPMITASNIHYELADRVQGLSAGGIGAMLLLARRIGLIRDIDHNLHLLKRHCPYHESDHVLNIAFNIIAGGKRMQHIELRRTDTVYLDALGAERVPDPTTEGDFCRRFSENDVVTLMDAINQTRVRVWSQQPASFFSEAVIDVDGTLVGTDAECKKGMDFAYNGTWGYHPLVISLANTAEPLYLINRSGNRPSHEHAAEALDKMITLCRQAGFKRITLRGDTDFTRLRISTAGIMLAMSASSSGLTQCPSSRRWPMESRTTNTASWSGLCGMRSRPHLEKSPNGSSQRSSESVGTKRSICSRR